MKTVTNSSQVVVPGTRILTLGDYAHRVIRDQYRAVIQSEKGVLADKDPENLHQMRVGMRRLRTALQVFNLAVDLPKAAQERRVGAIARMLGQLRDLDVQIQDLQDVYRSQLQEKERHLLDQVVAALYQRRQKVFAATEDGLTRSRYRELKTAYQKWFEHPQYPPLANLSLVSVLPDLLSPLLSELLLHPGWLVPAQDAAAASSQVLHDLRKACKHARYQTEFFARFYGSQVQEWVQEVKRVQDKLGKVHDSQVLLELMQEHLPRHACVPELQRVVQQTFEREMADWESLRQKYLDRTYRYHLHQMMLDPLQEAVEHSPLRPGKPD